MLANSMNSTEQKKARCSAIVWTIAYLILFPFMWMGIGFFFIEAVPSEQLLLNAFFRFIELILFFSMPFSIFFMWLSYSYCYYKTTRICCFIPPLTFALNIFFNLFN